MQIDTVLSAAGEISKTREARSARLKEACQQFEAIFFRYLLQKMQDTIPKDGLIERSGDQEMFRDLMNGALADSLSKTGQLGLAESLYKQLSGNLPAGPEESEAGQPKLNEQV